MLKYFLIGEACGIATVFLGAYLLYLYFDRRW
jgi:hypothetical protein